MRQDTYHDILDQEFNRRKGLNEAYSMRAFARDLGLTSSRLSQILNKKQGLSLQCAEQIVQKLKLSEDEKKWFFTSVGVLHSRNKKDRNLFSDRAKELKKSAETYSEIQLEYYKVIATWYHFAILELTYLTDFKNDHEWIARKLNITPQEVSEAIERLLKLDLIEEKDGTLLDVFKFLVTPSDIPSAAMKNFNIQVMKKAMADLYEQDVSNREYSTNIFSFSKEDLPKFKEKIRTFRRELEKEASLNPKKDSVYSLNIQFHELTHKLD